MSQKVIIFRPNNISEKKRQAAGVGQRVRQTWLGIFSGQDPSTISENIHFIFPIVKTTLTLELDLLQRPPLSPTKSPPLSSQSPAQGPEHQVQHIFGENCPFQEANSRSLPHFGWEVDLKENPQNDLLLKFEWYVRATIILTGCSWWQASSTQNDNTEITSNSMNSAIS